MTKKVKKSKQQKAKSKTTKTINQPKPEAKPDPEPDGTLKNLCDVCIYEFGECDGKPVFKEGTELVTDCETFQPASPELEGPDRENEPVVLWNVINHALEKLDDTGKKLLTTRTEEVFDIAAGRYGLDERPSSEDLANTLVMVVGEIMDREGARTDNLVPEPEKKAIPAPVILRAPLDRFQKDKTDYGDCQGCGVKLQRTTYSRYVDGIRCTNPRCRNYRNIVTTVPSGAK